MRLNRHALFLLFVNSYFIYLSYFYEETLQRKIYFLTVHYKSLTIQKERSS